MGYIKSYSNYVIKKKHQNTNDGTVFERDMSTIGGIERFSPGQIATYRSGNFIITINNDATPVKTRKDGKWVSNDDGDVWTYKNVKNYSSDTVEDDFVSIKHDFRHLTDFAYYGSCSELVRTSVKNIVDSFPGELYSLENISWYYPNGDDSDFFKFGRDYRYKHGTVDMNLILLENFYGIDLHTNYINESFVKNKLKYFCNDGYKNYQVLYGDDDTAHDILSYTVVNEDFDEEHRPCTGDLLTTITLKIDGKDDLIIYGFKSSNSGEVVYLVGADCYGIHIRPRKEFYNRFLKSLSSFENILVNPKTEPKYKATFQILVETDYGFDTKLEDFIFPVGNGGYNIGSDLQKYSTYIGKFLNYTNYYDEHFSDNLYRMLTHDSIKNFDWSYYKENDENEKYAEGESKISQLIRLFGMEFDNIKQYILGIKNYNKITYDDRNNIPDYFMTDVLELDGWDIKNIFPISLTEYDLDGNDITDTVTYDKDTQVTNQNEIKRYFSSVLTSEIVPYSKDNILSSKANGYYLIPKACTEDDDSNGGGCTDGSAKNYAIVSANKNDGDLKTFYFKRTSKTSMEQVENPTSKEDYDFSLTKKKQSLYTNNIKCSFKDINSLFLKRLKLNSKYILRHKGTVEGVEMILGMFGLKSLNFIASSNEICKRFNESDADYEINEYVTFSNGILDKKWGCKNMHTIDWYNYTKTFKYTSDIENESYTAYEGLPVMYRNVYYDSTDTRITDIPYKNIMSYDNDTNVLKYWDDDTNTVSSLTNVSEYRVLYPCFNSYDTYDGNPYYQMSGGWLRKYPYTFDNDDNIIESSFYNDLYTETLNTVKKVKNLNELVKQPIGTLENGTICYVEDLSSKYTLIDGSVYPIEMDSNGNYFVKVYIYDNEVTLGETVFRGNITLSNPYMYHEEGELPHQSFNLSIAENGSFFKVFFVEDKRNNNYVGIINSNDALLKFNIISFSESGTHYFKLIERLNKNLLGGNGWKQLNVTDREYIKINTITNYFKGNNPHNGFTNYDGGYDYIKNFENLFNYSVKDDLFDYRMYKGTYAYEKDFITNVGFKFMTYTDDADNCYKYYYSYPDSKIHYFGNYFKIGWLKPSEQDKISRKNASGDSRHDHVTPYSESAEDVVFNYDSCETWYDYADYSAITEDFNTINESYKAKNSGQTINTVNEGAFPIHKNGDICVGCEVDGSNYQIVNTKLMKITFHLNSSDEYSKEYMEEMKYYQSVVLPYVEQMIPSTTILSVTFDSKTRS